MPATHPSPPGPHSIPTGGGANRLRGEFYPGFAIFCGCLGIAITQPALPTHGLAFPGGIKYNAIMDTRELDELLPPAKYPYQEGLAIKRMRYTHDAMVDLIVTNPAISQNELAEQFGYTPSWVSLVMSSDAFKERLAARKEELVDPAIRATLAERFDAVVTKSLEVLLEKLSKPVSAIPDNLALRAAELGAKALGLGGNAVPVAPALPPDHLDQLAKRLVSLQRPGVTYDQAQVEDAQLAG